MWSFHWLGVCWCLVCGCSHCHKDWEPICRTSVHWPSPCSESFAMFDHVVWALFDRLASVNLQRQLLKNTWPQLLTLPRFDNSVPKLHFYLTPLGHRIQSDLSHFGLIWIVFAWQHPCLTQLVGCTIMRLDWLRCGEGTLLAGNPTTSSCKTGKATQNCDRWLLSWGELL